MADNFDPAKSHLIWAGNHVTIDPGCISHEELAEWLKLVEKDFRKAEISKVTELREPSAWPRSSRLLSVDLTVAGALTLASFAFLVWLVLKALSLLQWRFLPRRASYPRIPHRHVSGIGQTATIGGGYRFG
jgi:hypothetical protein